MRRALYLIWVSCLTSVAVLSQQANRTTESREYNGIVAVVNGALITASDLDKEVKSVLLSGGGVRNRSMEFEVLREMIRSKLKWQCVNKFLPTNALVSDAQADEVFKRLASDNQMSVKKFTDFLVSNGLNPDVIKQNIKVNLCWIEYIKIKFGKHINISHYELQKIKELIHDRSNKAMFCVKRISFPILDKSDEKHAAQRANNVKKMLDSGSNFSELAKKFSQGPEAVKGGTLGWIVADQVSSEEYNALLKMKIGEYRCVHNSKGVYIINLVDKKEAGQGNTVTNVRFVQIAVPKPEYAENQDTFSLLKSLCSHFDNVNQLIEQAKLIGCYVSEPVSSALDGLIPEIREALLNCKSNGTTSKIFSNDKIFYVICLLNKSTKKVPEPTLDEIRIQKINERMNTFADRELKELKERADIKLGRGYEKLSDII